MSKLHSFLSSSMRNKYTVNLSDSAVLTLMIGKLNPELDKLLRQYHSSTYAYLTAYNPHSTTLTTAENELRHRQLEKIVVERGFQYLTGLSIPESGDWEPEHCIFAFNMSRAVTRELCQLYDQDAAVVGDWGSAPKLFFTNPSLREDFLAIIQNCVLD